MAKMKAGARWFYSDWLSLATVDASLSGWEIEAKLLIWTNQKTIINRHALCKTDHI